MLLLSNIPMARLFSITRRVYSQPLWLIPVSLLWALILRFAPDMASGGTKKRSAQSSGSAETPAKSITDNMNLCEEYTYCKKVDGVTMLEQLCMDLRRRRCEPGFMMGARHYRELRELPRRFGPHILVERYIDPLTVDGALVRAMLATKRARPDHAVMKHYLDKVIKPLNHTELISCLKWGFSFRVSCDSQIASALSLLRYGARTMLQEPHPKKFDIMSVL